MSEGTKRGRKKMTDEEKEARKAFKDSPEGLRQELLKQEQKRAELLAKIAIKEHPELATAITTLSNYTIECKKMDDAVSLGVEASADRERNRLQKSIEHYENKLAGLRESLENLDTDRIVNQLQEKRTNAFVSLKRAMLAVESEFAEAGTSVTQLVPTIIPFMDTLASISVDESE